MAATPDPPTPSAPVVGHAGAAARRAELTGRIARATRRDAADRLAQLAARLLRAEAAQISVIDSERIVVGSAGVASTDDGTTTPLAESICRLAVVARTTIAVEDAAADARLAELPAVRGGHVASYLGVPLHVAGEVIGALCVFGPTVRSWTAEDRDLLEQIAHTVEPELEVAALTDELQERTTRLTLGFAAAGVGSFDLDLVTGALRFDERLDELFGFRDGASIAHLDEFTALVHPDDRDRVAAAIDRAVSSCGEYRAEYRLTRDDGGTTWVSASGRVLCDPERRPVRMLGAASDTSMAHDGAERVSRILETLTTGFYALDRQWRFTYVNAAAERLLGRPREELLGEVLWTAYPDLDDTQIGAFARQAMASGEAVTFEDFYAPLATWFEITQAPGADGLSVFFRDIGIRHEAELERSRATDRLRVIATASAELTATLDVGVAVGRFARLVVPLLADWCLVTLLEDAGTVRVVGSWHRDPERAGDLARFAGLLATTLTPESTIMRALTTAEPVVQEDLRGDLVDRHLSGTEMPGLALRLGARSATTIPLVARGRTVGTFTLVNGEERGEHSSEELTAATELAVRAALAVDNARLFEAEKRMSETLQRSMLSEPPEPDHLHIVTRYRPAEDHAQVGGDWYDSFLQPDGTTMLVIGDVMGHDISAAAAMGQLRTMVRTVASDRAAPPAEVLSRVDRALRTLGIDTFATAAIAQVLQSPTEARHGRRRVRWASAGHLPPLLRGPDEVVRPLTAAGVVLGVQVDAPRSDHEIVVEPGSTLLLYTDGLLERRGEVIDVGIARLSTIFAEADGASLDDLCDEVLARMLPEGAEDDVALVAIRFFAEDEPRPAEAGPQEVPPAVR